MHNANTIRGPTAWLVSLSFAVDPIRCLERVYRRHGPVVRLEYGRGGRKPVLALVGPGYNREVLLATDRLRPTGIWPVRAPEGSAQANLRRNYLTTSGAEHACFSEAVAPHLERGRVDAHFPDVRRIALAEIAEWPTGKPVDIYARFRALAQRFAFELLFGLTDAGRVRAFGDRLTSYHAANWSHIASLLRLDLPGMPYRRVLERADDLQSLVLGVMASRDGGCPMASNVLRSLANHTDAEGLALTPARAAAHISGFALAAYETTSITLTWAMVLLSHHPLIAAALTAEIAEAGPIETMSAATLAGLPLLDAVLKETLRLMTPVPILGFKTLRACNLGGVDLPEAATVVISPYLTHRMPELYDRPDQFLPERWLEIRPTTYEYLPFSGGPRRCPGFLFAQTNMRMALAALLTRFDVTVVDGARIDRRYAAVMVPRRGVPAVLEPRSLTRRPRPPPQRLGSAFDLFSPAAI